MPGHSGRKGCNAAAVGEQLRCHRTLRWAADLVPGWKDDARNRLAASALQASDFRSDVTAFRLNAAVVRKSGSLPAFRRNTAARVYMSEAAHNPEVAGSNPAPATGKGLSLSIASGTARLCEAMDGDGFDRRTICQSGRLAAHSQKGVGQRDSGGYCKAPPRHARRARPGWRLRVRRRGRRYKSGQHVVLRVQE